MIGSTTPCPAEPGLRPLRQPHARDRFMPASPTAIPGERWDAIHRNAFPQRESLPHPRREAFAMTLPHSLVARLRALVPDDEELGIFLADLALVVRHETGNGYDLSDSEAFAAGLPLEPRQIPQAHMQALVHDFRRRQRQASMLVAGCVAASFVLTVIGIAALASFAKSAPADAEPLVKNSSPVVWRQPQDAALPKLILAKLALYTEPAPIAEGAWSATPDVNTTPPSASTMPQLVVVRPGGTLELAPLLSQRQARYILVRGLPSEATLSAGQRNPSGAWLVKDRDLERLTLTIGGTASGDYPVEVYALGASSAPQARQRFMFRVEASAGPTPALATSASEALFNMALGTAPEQPAPTAEISPLMARAMRLLGEGDIAGARLLFMHLAEQGASDAAYQLARTFDAEVLTELGARGVGSDRTRAVGWYERASETGSTKAAERLKILASLSD
jgi:TPR repeat protein